MDPPRGPRPAVGAGATVALFAVVLGGELSGALGPMEAGSALYVLPIAVAAVTAGLRGGLAAGIVAVALLHVGERMGGASLGLLGHVTRDVVFAVTAVTLGTLVERMRARAELVRVLHGGFAQLGDGFVVLDQHTDTLLHASASAAKVYRRDPEALRGMRADELAGAGDRERLHQRRRMRNAGHRVPARGEFSIVGPAGEDIRVESALVPVAIGGEKLWAAVMRDVTQRRDTERLLAGERGFLRSVVDAAPTPIAVLDPDGRIVTANRAAQRLAGLGAALPAGRTPWELGLVDRDAVAAAGAALRAGEDPVRHVGPWRAEHEAARTMAWTLTAVGDADRRHVVAVGLDVTEQHAAEERARRAHAAREADRRALQRSRRDLATLAAASHHLRGSLAEIAAAIAGRDDEAAAVAAGDALDRVGRLLDAVDAFARLGAGEAIARDVDVERTVDAVLRDLAEDIAARGAAVSRGPLPIVAGDPAELRTLMAQLVGRALRPTPGAAPRVHVGSTRRDGGWELSVTHAGPADDDALELAVCRRIAERHGGALHAEDDTDGATALLVTLPDREAR